MTGKATLTEIETQWTIKDLFDALEALDIQAEVDHFADKAREGAP